MKNTIYILFVLLSMAANAQKQTVTLENRDGFPQPGIYYKDADNILTSYAGTYSFTTDRITFRLRLVEAKMTPFGGYHEDLLIGGYEYIVNGVIVANTLSQIEDKTLLYPQRSIYGSIINKNYSRPACRDCVINDKGLRCLLVMKITMQR